MTASFHTEPMYVSPIVDFFITILVSITGLLINWKYLKNMKEDDRMRSPGEGPSAIKDIMIMYTKIEMVVTPYYLFFNWFLHGEFFDLPQWFEYLLCYDQYLSNFTRIFNVFNSLVTASIRYMLIVHHDRVMSFGKDTLTSLFYHGSYIVPIILEVLTAFTTQMPENFKNPAQLICNVFHHESHNLTCKDINCIGDQYSPLLSFSHTFVPIEITDYLGIILKMVFVIIAANIVEGILYWKTFSEIKRLVILFRL